MAEMTSILDCMIHGKAYAAFAPSPPVLEELCRHGISMLGIARCGDGYQVVRRAPAFSHISICIEGQSEVLAGGRWLPFRAGMINPAPKGRAHGQRAVGQRWEFLWLSFLEGARWVPVLTRFEGPFFASSELLVMAAKMLCRETMGGERLSAGMRQACVSMVTAMLDEILGTAAAFPDPRLSRVWKLVAERPAHPWRVQELAAKATLSVEQFRRLCYRDFGHSPSEHLLQLRMGHACALLRMSNLTVAEVARRVGYANGFAFSQAFRRHVGCPPGTWRRQRYKRHQE